MNTCTYRGLLLTLLVPSVLAIQASVLASEYALAASTSLPFPTATLSSSDAQSSIISDWSLSKGSIQDQADDLAFVLDPFANSSSTSSSNSSSTVLQVTYPAGSYSHNTGGSQFVNLWNSSSSFQSMVLSYEVAFDENFDWVMGGKLPGLRGGPNVTGCSGGAEPTGLDCFSARLMWRPDGVGEVYAYIPATSSFCQDANIICNPDFGTSISRGSFTFVSGGWNLITLLVQLNDPTTANGNLQLYFNDRLVISRQDILFRTGSAVDANGLYFSTFFGGSDDSWATPTTTHTYFRNIQLWGGADPSNGTAINFAMRTIKTTDSLFVLLPILFVVSGLLL
ncbi:hypothetical protein BT96DRAFT_1011285 [Gymnopus androsaceus JB14]|uniref:Polysaccharide lyase 14 domain-containing protein n=1 Tax=Gymnopus androsaceus JB14 TaxID=1447944 RepID=A0A6A4IM22_9AGAR|nr:hypothetical protein BT96DRAFT_1011285 [Gymnopus androsaceus JB14]